MAWSVRILWVCLTYSGNYQRLNTIGCNRYHNADSS
ncbi:unnamed protein product [Chondrus crispus]|uniref:Uncharacterized protein n=1 Tax=Chondrus crispus TaxID=2769 RepID=R7Q6H6_CHOCR|nr:unnamed protein product [Chondrus crispus]CDF33060.1 unnamed protein product [Chondrus crispus]|eukprot:XP_005712863.1 unnamed protein product [Chondrus crispus]